MTTSTLNIHEIPTPQLNQTDREELLEALQAHLDGSKVSISVEYEKVTNSKPRIDGEHYEGLLGISKDTLIGDVKKIAKGKNGWYVLLDATLTRKPIQGPEETKKLGWTSIKGPGIKVLKGTRVVEK